MSAKIDEYFQRVRDENKKEQDRRIIKLHEEIPELKEIDLLTKKILVDITMQALEIETDAEAYIEEGTEILKGLRQRRDVVLTDNDYMPDYLDEIYTCELCKDRGFVNNKPCKCYREIEFEFDSKLSNLYSLMKKENFENFDYSLYSDKEFEDDYFLKTEYTPNLREYMYQVVDCLKAFVEDDSLGAYIYGDTGVGKTFLCSSVCKYAMEKGLKTEYYSMKNFVDIVSDYRFKSGNNYGENSDDYQKEYNKLFDCDLLIVDDLGTELGGKHIVTELFFLVNERLAKSKKTIISSNIPLENISEYYEERTASRIIGNYLQLPIVGEDLRK